MVNFFTRLFFTTAVIGFLLAPVWAQNGIALVTPVNGENINLKTVSGKTNSNRTDKTNDVVRVNTFHSVLEQVLIKRGRKKSDICDERDFVASRILRDYGSIFIVDERVQPPPVCVFSDAAEVDNFQKRIGIASATIAGTRIELQTAAMESLLKARAEAHAKGLDITPRNGAEAGRRSFADTIRLWKSRFDPACEYWLKKGRLTFEQVEKLKSLPVKEQVKEVLLLEKQGIYFNSSFNFSILYSIAAPGTSQHLALLAFDVNEYQNEELQNILARHGWYRTVRNDHPHFTFLGHQEADLHKLGLRVIITQRGKFWIPNV